MDAHSIIAQFTVIILMSIVIVRIVMALSTTSVFSLSCFAPLQGLLMLLVILLLFSCR